MNRNGLGSKRAKSISSTQAGKRRVADVGPDRIIRHFGASDIKGWYDATQPEIAGTANDTNLDFWYDKGPDQTHLYKASGEVPHYIHNGLNGRPIIRGTGATNEHYLTADSGGTAKNVDWSASCSVFVLIKTENDDNNQGIFGGTSTGNVPKSRFGCGSLQTANPDSLRVECFGRVNNGGEVNFRADNFFDMTGSTGLPTCRNQFALYYLEYSINTDTANADNAFTRNVYAKEATTFFDISLTQLEEADKVTAGDATTMASKGFDTAQMQVFRNIHDSMDDLDGEMGFLMFSNRHYSLKERQMISKAIQQIYGYADIN